MSIVFESSVRTSASGRTTFSLDLWEKVRDQGIRPEFHGDYDDTPSLRIEFLTGARLMGYELVDLDDLDLIASMHAESPPRYPLQPQQLWIADALNADGYDEYVVEAMRRASKTTSIFLWVMGRCLCRPNFEATFSAQTGAKGTARLREWKMRLDRTRPDPEDYLPPWRRGNAQPSKRVQRHAALFGDDELTEAGEPETRGFRIMTGEVGKGIYFDNGSKFLVLKPEADAYRGEAADVSWIDEAQELEAEEGEDLLAGIVPLQDTKIGSALVVSGTAGEGRVGVLWKMIERLRTGDSNLGGVDYCAPEDTPWETVEDEDAAMELLVRIHPGIGTLTTLDKMRKNWARMAKPQWAREYLSLWPETFGVRAVPAEQWVAATLTRRRPIPERVAFGMDIKPGSSVAAIVAAWRDSKGHAIIEVVEHRSGTRWVPERAQELTRKYRGSSIAFDDIAEGRATATEMLTMTPRPKMALQSYRDTAAGCVQLLRDLERGTMHHFDQVGLNAAVERAAKREVRNDSGVWLWKPVEFGDDITCLVAATRALRNWDQNYAKKRARITPKMGD